MPFEAKPSKKLPVLLPRMWIRGASRGRPLTRHSLSSSAAAPFPFVVSFDDVTVAGQSSCSGYTQAQRSTNLLGTAKLSLPSCVLSLFIETQVRITREANTCTDGRDVEAGKHGGRGISGFDREKSWWRGEAPGPGCVFVRTVGTCTPRRSLWQRNGVFSSSQVLAQATKQFQLEMEQHVTLSRGTHFSMLRWLSL